MRRTLLSMVLAAGCFQEATAEPVSLQTATMVATHFMASQTGTPAPKTTLAAVYPDGAQQPALYIFNVNQDKGFVIVSGDDIIRPVLGYSASGPFITSGMAPQVKYWLNGYSIQIQTAVENKLSPPKKTRDAWAVLTAPPDNSGHTARRATGVSPLLETLWDQMPRYNNLCPVPGGNYSSTPTGCVATAMAQIMYYWRNPVQGTDSNSYSSSSIGGTLSANFGATTYDWADMPASLSSSSGATEINAIATLMFHCGVAVEMDYKTAQEGGSGAYVISYGYNHFPCAENALKKYFGYKTSIHGEERINYDDSTWIAMLKTELDNGRPVLYAGYGSDGGHAFDFDGYDENDMFHINWGWSGMSNGYFTVDSLAPSALGAGGGNGNFNGGQQALMGIEAEKVKLLLNSSFTVSADSIDYNTPYAISVHIRNTGSQDFNSGRLLLFAADEANTGNRILIDSTEATIPSGGDYVYDFSSPGIAALQPGTYRLVYDYIESGDTALLHVNNGASVNGSILLTVTAPVGISAALSPNSYAVYPNPATNYLLISVKDRDNKLQAVDLRNMQGEAVFYQRHIARNTLSIPIGAYAGGIYLLRLETTKGRIVQKISVKK